MKANLVASLLVVLTFISCQKDTKVAEPEANKEVVSNVFKVTVDVNVSKDDAFHLYYTEDGTDHFSEENSIWTEFKATPTGDQQIVFTLPEDRLPTQIRLDLGVNKDQGDILFKNIKMEYAGKVFQANSTNFLNYFRPNTLNTVVDAQKGLISPVKSNPQYTGPSLYALPSLIDELQKITN